MKFTKNFNRNEQTGLFRKHCFLAVDHNFFTIESIAREINFPFRMEVLQWKCFMVIPSETARKSKNLNVH